MSPTRMCGILIILTEPLEKSISLSHVNPVLSPICAKKKYDVELQSLLRYRASVDEFQFSWRNSFFQYTPLIYFLGMSQQYEKYLHF